MVDVYNMASITAILMAILLIVFLMKMLVDEFKELM